jgi:hypothetical protein
MPKGFILDGNTVNFQTKEYEPLADPYLAFHFQRNRTYDHLRRAGLLSR